MAHFTLSKFKKAGQLAFLTGFIFVLSSCGGGGGGGNPPIDPPTDPTYTYKSFSEINASGVALSEACEAQESSCTESNALSLWQEISNASDYFLSAHHIRVSNGGSFCSYDSINENYSVSFVREQTDFNTSFNYGAQIGASSKYGSACTGADVSGRTYSLNDENVYNSITYSLPGALSGIIDLDYQYWGFTDSGLNEVVFTSKAVSQRENSGTYWSGNQYVIGALGDMDFGTSCNYFSSPKRCSSFSSDQTLDADLFALVLGFKTFSGDMPAAGTASYRTFAISNGIYGALDYMNFGIGAAVYNSECSQPNPSHSSCHWVINYSFSAEQFISVNYASKTLTGTLSLQNHYAENDKGTMELITNSSFDSFKGTLNNLVISATISGTSFSGTVSNGHYSGNITGYFYGPQAKEIAAIIRFDAEGVSGSDFATSGAIGVIMLNGRK